MKKKALVLLLVLSLVIGTFTGLSFMSASTALAGSESTFVTEEFLGVEHVVNGDGSATMNLRGSGVTIPGSATLNTVDVVGDPSGNSKAFLSTPRSDNGTGSRWYFNSTELMVTNAGSGTYEMSIWVKTSAATTLIWGVEQAYVAGSRPTFNVPANEWTQLKTTAEICLKADSANTSTNFVIGLFVNSASAALDIYVDAVSVKKVEPKQIINGNGTEMVTDGNAPAAAGNTVFLGSQKIAHFKTAGSTTQFNLGQDSVAGTDVDGNGRYFKVAKIELTDSEASNSAYRNKLPFFMTIDGFTAGEKYIVSAYAKLPAGSTDTVTAQLGTAATYAIHLATGDSSYLTHAGTVVALTTEWQKIELIINYNGAGDGNKGSGDKFLGLILNTPAAVDVDAISIQKVGTKTVTNYGSELMSNGTIKAGYTTKVGTGTNILYNYVNNSAGTSLKDRGYIVTGSDYDGSNAYYAIPQGTNSDAHRNKVVFYASLLADTTNFVAGNTYQFTCVARLPEGSTATDINVFWGASLYAAYTGTVNGNCGYSSEPVTLDNTWKTVTGTITIPATDNTKFSYFGLGINIPAAVDVDSISIKEVTGTETELDITEVSKVVPFEVKTEGSGIATVVGFGQRGKIYYGMETTVVAIPNASEFLGWYVGETCVSTDLEYTFIASEDGINSNEITAKFFTPNYLELVGDLENGVYNGLKKDGCTLTIVEDRLDADNKVVLATGRSTGANGIWFVITPEMAELADEVKYQFKARLAEDVADVENTLARLTVRTDYILDDASATKYATGVANKALTSTDWTTYDVTVDIDANLPAGATLKTVQLYLTSVVNVNEESTSGTSTGYDLEYDDFSATFIKDGKLVDVNTVTVDIEGDAEVVINNGNAPQYVDADGNVKATVLSGSEFTVTATDNDNYTLDKIAYKDQKFGANLATDNVATLTAYGTATNLTAKFVATEGVDYVTFKYVVDGKENIVAKLAEEDAIAFTEANAPKIYGKVFAGFKVNDGEVVTVLPADFADGDIVEIVYTLEQVDEAEKPIVSVEGENVSVSTQDGQDATGNVEPYTIVTFTATGDNFSYWVIKGTETVVSSKAKYTCYVVGDVELEAVYDAADAPTAVVTVKEVDTNNGLVIVADRSTSEGIITTYGVIISETAEFSTEETLVVGNKGTYADGRVIVSERNNGTTPNGTYVVSKGLKGLNGNYENGKTLYFRAYVIVDGAPVYSAISSADITVTE